MVTKKDLERVICLRDEKGRYMGTLKRGKYKQCDVCGKDYWCYPHLFNKKRFCSHLCYWEDKKGKPSPTKGIKRKPFTEEVKKKMSIMRKGKPQPWLIGKKRSEETRKKMSIAHRGKHTKEKNWNWKGGITPINKIIRRSDAFKKWRETVFQRDDYTCQFCGIRGEKLHPDHIKPFSLFPELRFDINNGRTLCVECHKNTDTYGGRVFEYAKKLGL